MPKKSPTTRPATSGHQLGKILVPTDFSAASRHALEYAIWLGKPHGAQIALLHVVEPLHPGSLFESGQTLRLRSELLARARATALELAGDWSGPDCEVTPYVRDGKAWQVIVEFARRSKTDLIVMSTHGQTKLSDLLLGSVVERVVRHASCPVTTLRP